MSSSPEELTLNGSTMEPQMAIDKEVLDKNKDDKVTHKDNRNLYLIKEGGMEIFFYMPFYMPCLHEKSLNFYQIKLIVC